MSIFLFLLKLLSFLILGSTLKRSRPGILPSLSQMKETTSKYFTMARSKFLLIQRSKKMNALLGMDFTTFERVEYNTNRESQKSSTLKRALTVLVRDRK